MLLHEAPERLGAAGGSWGARLLHPRVPATPSTHQFMIKTKCLKSLSEFVWANWFFCSQTT